MSRPSWAALFDRGTASVDLDALGAELAARRERSRPEDGVGVDRAAVTESSGTDVGGSEPDVGTENPSEPAESGDERRARSRRRSRPDPARVVADADVLAADLLVGGDARAALDRVREHSWITLVASEPLIDDAVAVIEELSDPPLATDWRAAVTALVTTVEHPRSDHPALAAALHGRAAHLLTLDETLTTADAGAVLAGRVETSPRTPAAFLAVFDAASLYAAVHDGEEPSAYPGPDRDPRS